MSRALVIGEALVDVVHSLDGTITEHPGGSPANVALGLARLGRDTDLATWFGADERGELIRGHLEDSGVCLVPGSDGAARTSTAKATLDGEGAASYSFDLDWQVPEFTPADDVVALHVGSIAATLAPGAAAVAEQVHAGRERATISYDPNARPTIMGTAAQVLPMISDLIASSDVVKVSDEDIEWLHPGRQVLEVAAQWATRGPAFVIVSRGGDGSVAITASGQHLAVPSPQVRVSDTVGAGDSYMSGLLDALWSADLLGAHRREALHAIQSQTLRAAMAHAARIAAITVSRPGANPPGRTELDEGAR